MLGHTAPLFEMSPHRPPHMMTMEEMTEAEEEEEKSTRKRMGMRKRGKEEGDSSDEEFEML